MDVSDFPVETITDLVLARLQQEPGGDWEDIFVWSDGTVTGPRNLDGPQGDDKLVSRFTPTGRLPDRAAVRESIVAGLATVDPNE